MSKSKKRKKNTNSKKVIPLKPHNYIQKIARKLPIHECIIDENWNEIGLTSVFISRKRRNGNIVLGSYILDTFCLGIKDTFFHHNLELHQYQEAKEDLTSNMQSPKVVDPVFAFNLIYGAVEYAEDLGFEPHKDFKITEYILDDVENLEVLDIPFGKDGKPLYISGPYDSSERILKILEKNVGIGNFDFIAQEGFDAYDQDFDDDEDYDWESFFTDEQIEKKLATFDDVDDEANSLEFKLLLNIAEEMNDYVEGDLSVILHEEFDTDEMLSEVGFNIISTLNLIEETKGSTPLDEDMIHFLIDRIQFIFESFVDTGNFNFLIDPDFIPIPKEPSKEELSLMSQEEQDQHLEQKLSVMTLKDRSFFLLSMLVYQIIERKENEGLLNHISEELTEEIIREILAEEGLDYPNLDYSEIDKEYIHTMKNIIHDLVTEYNNSKAI